MPHFCLWPDHDRAELVTDDAVKLTPVTKNKLTVLAAAVALSVGLAACGGGSSKTTDSTDPTPAAIDMSNVTTGANVQAGTFTIEAGGSFTAGDVTYSCAAGGADCMVAVAADGSATSTGGTATAANSTSYQARLDAEAEQRAAEEALQAEKDKQAAAAAKAAAKEALALFNGMGDNTNDLALTSVTVTDTDGGGGSAKVTASGATPNVAGDDVVKTAVPMLGKWQGTMLTDTVAASGDSSTVVVYTDVEANTRKAWSKVYTNVDAQTVATLRGVNSDAVIAASAFSSTGLKDHHADRNTTSNVVTVSGTFDGASGAYTCTSASAGSCTSNQTSDGVVLSDGWSFNPVDNATVSQPDANYAYFGWWLNKNTNGPEVDVFHGYTGTGDNPGAVNNTSFNALGGTATYTRPTK